MAEFGRWLENEVRGVHVGVNLYLTPEALEDEEGGGKQDRQGFEAHWDWMDGERSLQEVFGLSVLLFMLNV